MCQTQRIIKPTLSLQNFKHLNRIECCKVQPDQNLEEQTDLLN